MVSVLRAGILLAPSLAVVISYFTLFNHPRRLDPFPREHFLLIALAVVLFDLVLVVRGSFCGSWKVAAAGWIGLLAIVAVPVLASWLAVRAVAAVDSDWAVRAQLRALDLLKDRSDIAGLGRLQALEGSGHTITRHPWDIVGGINGNLVLFRRGRFDAGGYPIVIVAFRGGGGKETKVPAIISEKDDTFLQYAHLPLPDRFIYVVLDCPRPRGPSFEEEPDPTPRNEPSNPDNLEKLRVKALTDRRQEIADESVRLSQRIAEIAEIRKDWRLTAEESAALSAEEKAALEKLPDLQKRLEEMDSPSTELEAGRAR